jgi:hypothetical protein
MRNRLVGSGGFEVCIFARKEKPIYSNIFDFSSSFFLRELSFFDHEEDPVP